MVEVNGVEIKVDCVERYFFDSTGVTIKYSPRVYSSRLEQMVEIKHNCALQPTARAAIAYATKWAKEVYQIYD